MSLPVTGAAPPAQHGGMFAQLAKLERAFWMLNLMEMFERLAYYGVRVVIGKGGMGAKTLAALKEHGAVYLNAIGGAAQFYSRAITGVEDVSLMEFGTPEAMWHLTVKDFPAIVTMDAHGNSLHRDIEQQSGERLETVGA